MASLSSGKWLVLRGCLQSITKHAGRHIATLRKTDQTQHRLVLDEPPRQVAVGDAVTVLVRPNGRASIQRAEEGAE